MNVDQDQIPCWDNSHIFTSLDDPKLMTVLETTKKVIAEMSDEISKGLSIEVVQKMLRKREELLVELDTASSFASSISSVNGKNEQAPMLSAKISKILSDLGMAMVPVDNFLQKVDEKTISEILNDDVVKEMEFTIRHAREMKDFCLSDEEEKLLEGMSQNGIHAWGRLYDTIAGHLECVVDGETLGYAKTANLLFQADRKKRESAWRAIQKVWKNHEDSASAILNSINGWRIDSNKFRSRKRELHYLDESCHQSHINRKTLNSLMDSTYENREIGKRAIRAMAKFMDLKQMAPWDLMADAPIEGETDSYISFSKAMDYITEAFSLLTPEMGEFAQMMYKKNWIDARPTEYRSPGAYCGGFFKYREPRVFMTYDGSMGNITTLAHELGHAYHSWVMRDLPFSRTGYAMTTVETASIFGETLVRNYLFEKLDSKTDKLKVAWDDAQTASALICNIPARFEFERMLVEARKEQVLSPNDLKKLMKDAWGKWYEDSLSEYDEMFWASKLHFSISELSFYNYPYLFGLLFSLGIYSYKDQYGDKFSELYTNVLRDTGSMNAIDLIKKHFNVSIEEKEFWQNSLNILGNTVSRFEQLVQ